MSECWVLVLVALLAAGTVAGAAPPKTSASSVTSVAAETFVGGMTADEEAAGMAVLHGWLMQEMPAGVLNNPIRVSLSAQEKGELQKRQQEKGGPAVIGRTKAHLRGGPFRRAGRGAPLRSPRAVGRGLLRATPDGGFVWAAAVESEGAAALRVHLSGMNLPMTPTCSSSTSRSGVRPLLREGPQP